MEYSEQLKSPKWQKKRLEILNRDEFKCNSCLNDSKQLHVHHKFYKKDLLAWEYKDNVYTTLCEECHNKIHLSNKQLNHDFFLFSEKCINEYQICLDKDVCIQLGESLKNRYNTFYDFLFHNDYDETDIYIFDSFNSILSNIEFTIVIDEIDFENEIIFISRLEVYK